MKIVEMLKAKCQLQSRKGKTISRALKCKGWTNENKLSILYDLAQKTDKLNGDVLEIGSAWGRSTVLLGLSTTKKIWSIDPHTGGIAYIRRGEEQNSFEEFKKNLKINMIEDKVIVLRNTTSEVEINELIPGEVKFSLVFIDGLHTKEGVEIDFNYAYKRLVDSGIMIFDDYFETSLKDYGEMIDKLISDNRLVLVKDIQSRIVYFKKHVNNSHIY